MADDSKAPKAYTRFVERYPHLGSAWDLIHAQGKDGPIDAKSARLIKIGIAIGAMREGQVHAGVRKALRMGINREELEQVVAMAAATLGMPATVAAFCWINDVLDVGD